MLALWGSTCSALFITGIGKLMEGPANGRRNGTFDLLAYSQLGNAKNETSNDSFNNRFPAQVVAGATITLSGPPAGVPRNGFTPVLGLTGGMKQNVQGFATVVSVTLDPSGKVGPSSTATATYNPPGILDNFPNGRISASGRLDNTAGAKAAGKAVDPFIVPSSSMPYSYTIQIGGISMGLATGEQGYVDTEFFATDSRFPDPLWTLDVGAVSPLNDKSALLIRFESNPILNLDKAAIESLVFNNFTVGNGVATLDTLTLPSTSYLVTSTITYSDGVTAVAETIPTPEPTALLLLATGAVGLAARAGIGRLRAMARRRGP